MDILQVDVQTKEEQEKLLSNPLLIKGHLSPPPIPSSEKASRFILVKPANVPIASAVTLESVLHNHWKQFGEVKEIAPHCIPGKP